jgi:hypothetical protein
MNRNKLLSFVKSMKVNTNTREILDTIQKEKDLTNKCILYRKFLSPQSTHIERIIRNDLFIEKPINETSGDGTKNGLNYEIKYSGHAQKSRLNFVQIRPDHNIDFYILIGYNMYFNDNLGKAFVFKIPSAAMYDLVVKHGGYSHGTLKHLGRINKKNLKGRNLEYSIRCNPNAKRGTKDYKLFHKLLQFETEYISENF